MRRWEPSIWDACYQSPRCSRPDAFCGTSRPNASAWPCARWGLPSRRCHQPRWCALTTPFHPHIPSQLKWVAISSLLHLPSRYRAWPLASIVPYGVRTFLSLMFHKPRFPCLPSSTSLYRSDNHASIPQAYRTGFRKQTIFPIASIRKKSHNKRHNKHKRSQLKHDKFDAI